MGCSASKEFRTELLNAINRDDVAATADLVQRHPEALHARLDSDKGSCLFHAAVQARAHGILLVLLSFRTAAWGQLPHDTERRYTTWTIGRYQ
jgi:hypothetical protein